MILIAHKARKKPEYINKNWSRANNRTGAVSAGLGTRHNSDGAPATPPKLAENILPLRFMIGRIPQRGVAASNGRHAAEKNGDFSLLCFAIRTHLVALWACSSGTRVKMGRWERKICMALTSISGGGALLVEQAITTTVQRTSEWGSAVSWNHGRWTRSSPWHGPMPMPIFAFPRPPRLTPMIPRPRPISTSTPTVTPLNIPIRLSCRA